MGTGEIVVVDTTEEIGARIGEATGTVATDHHRVGSGTVVCPGEIAATEEIAATGEIADTVTAIVVGMAVKDRRCVENGTVVEIAVVIADMAATGHRHAEGGTTPRRGNVCDGIRGRPRRGDGTPALRHLGVGIRGRRDHDERRTG